MKDNNFTLAFQVLGFDDNGKSDFNFRVPPEIGRWIATLRTIDYDGEDFTLKNVNVPLLTRDEYPNFKDDFGIKEDQENKPLSYMKPQYILDLSGIYLEKASLMSAGFTTLDVQFEKCSLLFDGIKYHEEVDWYKRFDAENHCVSEEELSGFLEYT